MHLYEDEYSFVIEGVIGARIGDEIVDGGPGTCTTSLGVMLIGSQN